MDADRAGGRWGASCPVVRRSARLLERSGCPSCVVRPPHRSVVSDGCRGDHDGRGDRRQHHDRRDRRGRRRRRSRGWRRWRRWRRCRRRLIARTSPASTWRRRRWRGGGRGDRHPPHRGRRRHERRRRRQARAVGARVDAVGRVRRGNFDGTPRLEHEHHHHHHRRRDRGAATARQAAKASEEHRRHDRTRDDERNRDPQIEIVTVR